MRVKRPFSGLARCGQVKYLTLNPNSDLVNNAASWEGDTFLPGNTELENKLVELWTVPSRPITASTFDQLFGVNTRAAALMMAEFARRHAARGAQWGRIINVSTAGAERFPSEVTYGASKFAPGERHSKRG